MDPSWTPDAPPGDGETEEDEDQLPDLDAFVGGGQEEEDEEEELMADTAVDEEAAPASAARGGAATLGRRGPRAGSTSSSSTPDRRELSGTGLRLPQAKDKNKGAEETSRQPAKRSDLHWR